MALLQMLHGDLLHRNPSAGTVRGGAATGEGPHAGGVNILRPGLNGLGRGCAPILRIRLRQTQQRRRGGETFAVALQIAGTAIADQQSFEHTVAARDGSIIPINQRQFWIVMADRTAKRIHNNNDGFHGGCGGGGGM